MSRLSLGHLIVFGTLALAGAAIAADQISAVQHGRSTVAVRSGEAGDAEPDAVTVGGRQVYYCGYAPCGMPILCPGQEL